MSTLETRLETARSLFMAHRNKCRTCEQFNFRSSQLPKLCWEGTSKYRALLNAENEYMSNERRQQTAKEKRQERRRMQV